MGRRSEVMKLPFEVRAQLDDRLRAGAYGDYIAQAGWLAAKGYEVSKSALHRYGVALRQSDAQFGRQDAVVAQVQRASGAASTGIRDGLLLELGRLRYQESRVLAELAQLDNGISQ